MVPQDEPTTIFVLRLQLSPMDICPSFPYKYKFPIDVKFEPIAIFSGDQFLVVKALTLKRLPQLFRDLAKTKDQKISWDLPNKLKRLKALLAKVRHKVLTDHVELRSYPSMPTFYA